MTANPHLTAIPIDRDLRADVARGLALLIICSDHALGNPIRQYMPVSLGFSDMAELFIFLSGYVNGISRPRPQSRRELTKQFGNVLYRSLLIYVAIMVMHAATALVLELTAATGAPRFPMSSLMLPRNSECNVVHVLTLKCLLFTSSVLALYLTFLWTVPILVILVSWNRIAAILASYLLYAAVQLWPTTVSLPHPWAEAIYFNPLAWQLPFVLGIAIGSGVVNLSRVMPRNIVALVVALGVLELIFIFKVYWNPAFSTGTDKPTLGPLRLLHFYFVLIVARFLLPRQSRFLKWAAIRPLLLCGRHSLSVYCAGGIFAALATILFARFGPTLALTVGVNCAGWLSCVGTAYLAELLAVIRRGRSVSSRQAGPTK